MKKFLYILLSCCTLFCVSCKEENPFFEDESNTEWEYFPSVVARYLTTSQKEYYAESSAGTYYMYITSIETPWVFNSTPEWISLTPSAGSESADVSMNVQENKSTTSGRTAVFDLASADSEWDYSIPISVTQSQASPYIYITKNDEHYLNVTFTGAAANDEYTVNANFSWTAVAYNDEKFLQSCDWIKLSKTAEDKIRISVDANTTGNWRYGNVVFYIYDNEPVLYLDVSQSAPNMTISTDTLSYERAGGVKNLTITSDAPWSATTRQAWIELEPSSGKAGESTLKVSTTPNTSTVSRTGYVDIAIGEKVTSIVVEQDGEVVAVSPTYISIDADGGKATVNVTSNTDWKVSLGKDDYMLIGGNDYIPATRAKIIKPIVIHDLPVESVHLSDTVGSGNGSFTVTVDKNTTSLENRSLRIYVSTTSGSARKYIRLSQAARTLKPDETILQFGSSAGSRKVFVNADAAWTVSDNQDWVEVSPLSATGSDSLIVSVKENFSGTERNDTVYLNMGDGNVKLYIQQQGKYFNIADPELQFTSKGGVHAISISSDAEWSVKVSDVGYGTDWITLSETSGKGDCNIDVTAADNPSLSAREVEVQLSSGFRIYNFLFTQAGRYLKLNTNRLTFAKKGGTLNVQVLTDGEFEVSTTDSWYNYSVNEKVVTITAEEHTGDTPRSGSLQFVLKGLKAGEVATPVTLSIEQYAKPVYIVLEEYDEEISLDDISDGNVVITIGGFKDDVSLDY